LNRVESNLAVILNFVTSSSIHQSSTMSTTAVSESKKVTSFEVYVSKETFKFHAAHFVAFQGYRERLHGHNYQVGVRILGSRKISADGYVVDFGNIKAVTRKVCKELNEHFLCPTLSDVMEITVATNDLGKESVTLSCQDGSTFVFPKDDCAMLPIVHATTEELAIFLWSRILEELNSEYLLKRGVHTMEVTVAEAAGQEAIFRLEIPADMKDKHLDVRSFIMEGEIVPMPCASAPEDKPKKTEADCGGNCDNCRQELSKKLQALADAINNKTFATDSDITVKDLETAIGGL
jgi:6-pyruvoyl-tetrahydropterin synthase